MIPKYLYSPNIVPSKLVYSLIIVSEVLLFFLIWYTITPKMNPSPIDIFNAFFKLQDLNFPYHLLISFMLTFKAILLSTCISLVLSYFSKFAIGLPLATFISTCRFMGLTGILFVFTMFTSGGESLKLSLLTFSMTVFLTTSMIEVVWSIPRKNFDLAKSLKMNEFKAWYEIVILGTMDKMFDCVGQNIAIVWMMLATVEGTIRSAGGIGTLLKDQEKHFHLAEVFAMQIVILITGYFLYFSIKKLKHLICPYSNILIGKH